MAPIFDPPAILEDAGLQNVSLAGISAGAGETQTLVVTATSDNPGLIPSPAVTYTSPQATGSLSYTPVANQAGSAVITVRVMDNGGTAGGGVDAITRTFTVNVTPVNDPPTISNVADRSLLLSTSSGAIPFTIGDLETPAGSLLVSATTSNAALIPLSNIIFGGSDANRTVTVTPLANQMGLATITVTVSDGSGGAASDAFVVTVSRLHPWQNPVDPLNVDDLPGIVPLDALLIFNEVNNRVFTDPVTGQLPPPFGPFGPLPYYDVNGDDRVTSIDALMVINEINFHRINSARAREKARAKGQRCLLSTSLPWLLKPPPRLPQLGPRARTSIGQTCTAPNACGAPTCTEPTAQQHRDETQRRTPPRKRRHPATARRRKCQQRRIRDLIAGSG